MDEMEMEMGGGATPIAEVFADEIVFVRPDATLTEVARELSEANVGVVVVGERAKPSGVISERDIVHAVAEGRDPTATRAADLAQSELLWCDVTSTVAEVTGEMMEHYVRHVLVEQDGALAGVVSARDLLGAYAAEDVFVEEE
ncbi:MAG TPA: CBS domain-containing protein [Acidimicrobiales bacterium]|nr:CBS domain-containing protein [Acidimicrobiales bacterium]HXY44302.1 CBS domain-containing protein [Acidimicrobiales bacterium]